MAAATVRTCAFYGGMDTNSFIDNRFSLFQAVKARQDKGATCLLARIEQPWGEEVGGCLQQIGSGIGSHTHGEHQVGADRVAAQGRELAESPVAILLNQGALGQQRSAGGEIQGSQLLCGRFRYLPGRWQWSVLF